MKTTKDIALTYFNSWQEPADYEAFRRELADDVVFDGGAMSDDTGATIERCIESG